VNHRQRVLAAIHHEPVDRVPTDLWAVRSVQHRLFHHFGIDAATDLSPEGIHPMDSMVGRQPEPIVELFDRLEVDGIFRLMPPYIGPALRCEDDHLENEWGMGFRHPPHASDPLHVEQVTYPLSEARTIQDLDAYRWPDPDWYDYDALVGLARRVGDRAICVGFTAPFYYHSMLRGLEVSLMDTILAPELTHRIVERLSDFFTEFHRRCFEAGRGLIDLTHVTDDFGSQKGLLISHRTFDEFYRPAMQRAIDLAAQYGIVVFHHDDGDIRPLLPTLVALGIQVLNPIQWRSGYWDLVQLKADFGKRLCFHGAVDNQHTLPFGTPEDVTAEIKHLISALASDHTGFILAPCHNLQHGTPVANILAMYEAALEFGTFT
jgi:uroporphyrinogen decarboxylase